MFRAVLDTNVLASGLVGYARAGSTPGELLRLWSRGSFEMIVSQPILVELERTLAQPYFARRLSPELRTRVVGLLRNESTVVEISRTVERLATHEEDDLILATALSADAEYLVTGDRALLEVESHRGVAIVSPRAFLDLMNST